MIGYGDLEEFVNLLGTSDIQEVAAKYGLNRPTDPSCPYYERKSKGISILFENGAIDSIFLFGNGKDGFKQYRGGFIHGLSFNSTKTDVRRVMGNPHWTGGPNVIGGGMTNGGWDKFAHEDIAIHFTYRSSDLKIELVTLSRMVAE